MPDSMDNHIVNFRIDADNVNALEMLNWALDRDRDQLFREAFIRVISANWRAGQRCVA